MNDNQLKSINGQINKNSLSMQLQTLQANGTIAFCSMEYRNGYENYDSKQFYAPFYIEFQNGEGWLLFSSSSIRNDRMNNQQWNSLHLKRIARNITRSYLVIPDDIFINEKEKAIAESYQRKITTTMYSAIEDVCYQTEILELIVGHARELKGNTIHLRSNCIPLYSLHAACSAFAENEKPEVEDWIDVSGHGFTPNAETQFVIHAKGNSMFPKIKDGDLCVFEWYNGGERNGEIVLIECPDADNDYGCKYTIKKYYSEKIQTEYGLVHEKIELRPLNSDYSVIELNSGTEYKTIGLLKCVL